MTIKRNHDIDDSAFDKIDVDWKAYLLGLLMADGSIRGNQVRLKLQKKDVMLLEQIRTLLCLTRPLSQDGASQMLYFSSKQIGFALMNYGMRRNKTTRLSSLPPIPAEMMPHFVRGFFDGDGTIAKVTAKPNAARVAICCVCEEFLIALQNWLSSQGIRATLYKENREGKTFLLPQGIYSDHCLNMYSLLIPTFDDKAAFFQLCWANASIYLDRKQQRFVDYIANAQYRKTFHETQGSYRTPWPDVYQRYINGEEVRVIVKDYGANWRSFYHWMKRENLPTRSKALRERIKEVRGK